MKDIDTQELKSPKKFEEDGDVGKEKKTEEAQSPRKDGGWVKYLVAAIIVSLLFGSVSGAIFGFMAGRIGVSGFNRLSSVIDGSGQKVLEKKGSSEKISVIEEDSAVIDSVEQASPTVVSIVITKEVSNIQDPFFDPFGLRNSQGSGTEKREIGGGTGFIVDPSGYIITNKHVVEDMTAEYTVVMNDGKKVGAQVLARDPFNDLAVIKVEEKNLPTVTLGDSDALKIGQTVIAIGNSLGEFRNTVSKGIISGLKRSVNAGDGLGQSELLEEVIQTDAAINPGNSGGPLLNIEGQVIGINVAMAQEAENIGFAIPVNQVKKVLQNVKETGRIVRPYLGIRYVIVNEQIKQENNLPYEYGALVVRGDRRTDLAIIPGSPADKAGIVENDIVLEIDGEQINSENDLAKVVRDKNVGEEVTLKVWSKGSEKTVKVRLEEAGQ